MGKHVVAVWMVLCFLAGVAYCAYRRTQLREKFGIAGAPHLLCHAPASLGSLRQPALVLQACSVLARQSSCHNSAHLLLTAAGKGVRHWCHDSC